MSNSSVKVLRCAIRSCHAPYFGGGYCEAHRSEYRDPVLRGKSPRTKAPEAERFNRYVNKNGPESVVPEAPGQCWLWVGAVKVNHYSAYAYGNFSVERDGKRRYIAAHRWSAQQHQNVPDDRVIDHICHNTMCVRPDHLRVATHQENGFNRARANTNSKTGVRGVTRYGARYRAFAHKSRRAIHLGIFDTLEEARLAAEAGRRKYHIFETGEPI